MYRRIIGLLLLTSVGVFAQTIGKPTECYIVQQGVSAEAIPVAHVVWSPAPPVGDVTKTTLNGVPLGSNSLAAVAGGLAYDLPGGWKPDLGVKTAELGVVYGKPEISVTVSCDISTAKDFKDQMFSKLQEAAKTENSADQKNIFTGINVADPSGQGAQGNAEIHLNGTLPGLGNALKISANLIKSSADNADPKEFDVSVTFRKQHLFVASATRNVIKAAQSKSQQEMAAALADLRKRFWLAISLDAAGRLEAQAMNFNVTNAVADIPLEIASRTKELGHNGYFFWRVIPAGIEAGKNLRSDDPTNPKYTILRYKAGTEFGLFWKAPHPDDTFPKKIMLECKAVDRYLFENETAYDATAKKALAIARGNQYYAQADLKIYVADTSQGSYAFRVSFVRGALPPVFGYTHTFLYGFVFESKK